MNEWVKELLRARLPDLKRWANEPVWRWGGAASFNMYAVLALLGELDGVTGILAAVPTLLAAFQSARVFGPESGRPDPQEPVTAGPSVLFDQDEPPLGPWQPPTQPDRPAA